MNAKTIFQNTLVSLIFVLFASSYSIAEESQDEIELAKEKIDNVYIKSIQPLVLDVASQLDKVTQGEIAIAYMQMEFALQRSDLLAAGFKGFDGLYDDYPDKRHARDVAIWIDYFVQDLKNLTNNMNHLSSLYNDQPEVMRRTIKIAELFRNMSKALAVYQKKFR